MVFSDYRIIFIGILCFLILIVVCSGFYWFVVKISERAKAFEGYRTARTRYGGAKKVLAKKEKERKQYEKIERKNRRKAHMIHKYEDASRTIRSIYDGYCNDKKVVNVVIMKTSLGYVNKILRRDGIMSSKIVSDYGYMVKLRIEL